MNVSYYDIMREMFERVKERRRNVEVSEDFEITAKDFGLPEQEQGECLMDVMGKNLRRLMTTSSLSRRIFGVENE